MKTRRSFIEYFREVHDDLFWSISEEYIRDRFDVNSISTGKLHKIGEYEIADVRIDYVWVEDLPGTALKIDALTIITLEVFEGNHHYDNVVESTVAILVSCNGDLSDGLKRIRIEEVAEYKTKELQQKPMDDMLVPYITRGQYEETAKDILETYYPEALRISPRGDIPVWVDPMELAKRVGLTVNERRIEEDASVFGQLYFEDTEAKLYDEKTGNIESVYIEGKTILVEPQMYFLRNIGSVNNTIVHECVHWIKHRKAFLLEKIYNNELSNISCKVVGGGISPLKKDATVFMEQQANRLTPMIQMPAKPFRAKAVEYISLYMKETGALHENEVMEYVIDRLATEYVVSRQAAKFRLIDLGFESAIGTFTYVDGHYVRPHGFAKGKLSYNQTFTIPAQDAAIQRFVNDELRELTKDGDYLFVENHYVYNAPLYVERDLTGRLRLTSYALSHMDECCLVFDMRITGGVETEYHTICYLNREPSNVTFEMKFHNGYENSIQEKQLKMRQEEMREWMEVRMQMTDNPEQCMELLLGWRNMTYVSLGDSIDLHDKTISRTAKGKTAPKLETIVRICFGLRLPPVISEKLLDVFGIKLMPTNEKHMWIREALNIKYAESYDAAKEYLEFFGVEI